jgi:arylsulfatase
MKSRFDAAAERFAVYPLDDRGAARLAIPKPLVPGADPETKRFTYFTGATRIAEPAAPPMKNRSWRLTAKLKTDGAATEGVIMAFGGVAAGMSLYLRDGVPVFDYNYFEKHTVVKGNEPLPTGESTVDLDFDYAGDGVGQGATLRLKVDGNLVAEGQLQATVPGRFGIDTFGIGEDSGQPVTFDYEAPFKFTGEVEQVTVEIQ